MTDPAPDSSALQAPATVRAPRPALGFLRQTLLPLLLGAGSGWLLVSSAAGTKYLITAALFALTLALEPLLGAGPADRAGRRRRNRGVVFVVAALVIYGAVWLLLLLAMRTLVG